MALTFLGHDVHTHKLLRVIYLRRVQVRLPELVLLFLLLDHRSEGDSTLLPVVAG